MKIKVYTTPKFKKETVYLRLVDQGNRVVLQVVDDQGNRVNRGDLLSFRCDGSVIRQQHVNSELGFMLDDEGRLIIE